MLKDVLIKLLYLKMNKEATALNYVIIGNSAAAVGCIEAIRENDTEGKITVITDEPYHTYSRPLISYLLEGKTDLDRMKYRGSDFYNKYKAELISSVKAEKIDPEKHTVTLSDGRALTYDKLLVATGSRPFFPPVEGIDKVKNSFTFMKLHDALMLDNALFDGCRVLILGAGLIGLKCAEGIYSKAGKITIVDLAPRILPAVLNEKASEIMADYLTGKGIDFKLGLSVSKFISEKDLQKAVLSDGTEIDFDILVVSTGVRPNTSLVSDAGGKVNRGICTDKNSKTSIEDIYAAGDCSESHDITIDSERILALLPNAYLQGAAAGHDMSGHPEPFECAIPMNSAGFFGLHIITAGDYNGDIYEDIDGENYKLLVTKDGTLKGFILIGDVKKAGIYTAMIRNKTPIENVDFEMMLKSPQLMAFSRDDRTKVLGRK